jgi:hypothetical protein
VHTRRQHSKSEWYHQLYYIHYPEPGLEVAGNPANADRENRADSNSFTVPPNSMVFSKIVIFDEEETRLSFSVS